MVYTPQTDEEHFKERLTVLNAIKHDFSGPITIIVDEEIKYIEHTLISDKPSLSNSCIVFR